MKTFTLYEKGEQPTIKKHECGLQEAYFGEEREFMHRAFCYADEAEQDLWSMGIVRHVDNSAPRAEKFEELRRAHNFSVLEDVERAAEIENISVERWKK